jgi:hypothetical protein
MVPVSHTTVQWAKAITSYNMVPCIFLCGPVENMLGTVKCGSKLALDDDILQPLIRRNAVCSKTECLENNKAKCIDIIHQLNKYFVCLYLRFSGVHVVISLVFCIMFYGSLFVLLWFFAWLLCCMSFDLLLLITPLLSASCSCLAMRIDLICLLVRRHTSTINQKKCSA